MIIEKCSAWSCSEQKLEIFFWNQVSQSQKMKKRKEKKKQGTQERPEVIIHYYFPPLSIIMVGCVVYKV